jgi:hypothetical protein
MSDTKLVMLDAQFDARIYLHNIFESYLNNIEQYTFEEQTRIEENFISSYIDSLKLELDSFVDFIKHEQGLDVWKIGDLEYKLSRIVLKLMAISDYCIVDLEAGIKSILEENNNV